MSQVGIAIVLLVLLFTGALGTIIWAAFQVGGELMGAASEVTNELDKVTDQTLQESCKNLDNTSCDTLKFGKEAAGLAYNVNRAGKVLTKVNKFFSKS